MSLAKKRKLSDSTAQDTNYLLSALAIVESTLDENDEEQPFELISSIEKLRAKLEVVQHTSFSKVDPFTLLAAHIQVGPLLFVAATPMRYEIEALGKADPASSLLSFDSTIKLIKLVRNHVSIMTEAGCRVLINTILLRLASTLQNETSEVNIIPEFPIPKPLSQWILTGCHSAVWLIIFSQEFHPSTPISTLFVLSTDAGTWSITPPIIEAKKDRLTLAVPQATVAVASYCKQHKLPVLRGCITSGEQWAFFVYKSNSAGGVVSVASEINLVTELENLPLVLGLLRDLVENTLIYEQKRFSYP